MSEYEHKTYRTGFSITATNPKQQNLADALAKSVRMTWDRVAADVFKTYFAEHPTPEEEHYAARNGE